MYQGVPYIASQRIIKGQIQAISRHMEGQESNESDPCQGKLQKDLDYAHIPMYAVIGEKAAYIIFYIVLGMIKETSKDKMWSMGSKESALG